MNDAPLPTAVRWVQTFLSARLKQGDIVVDATAGNGHDTLFLAQHVMPSGKVFAFDVQSAALESTRHRLAENGFGLDDIALIHAGHETLNERLPVELRGRVHAFMFNLGFLPGSDKSLITRTETTLSALTQATEWLIEGGLITVVAYPGHDGGREEGVSIEQWMAELSADAFEAQKITCLNFRPTTPFCMIVRKRTTLPPVAN